MPSAWAEALRGRHFETPGPCARGWFLPSDCVLFDLGGRGSAADWAARQAGFPLWLGLVTQFSP